MANNTFLYVTREPKPGQRVGAVEAVVTDGREDSRISVPFASAPYGTWDRPVVPSGRPLGPGRVERAVSIGTVGWILGREARGVVPPSDMVEQATNGMPGRVRFARLIALPPDGAFKVLVRVVDVDPTDPKNYGVGGRMVCTTLVARGVLVGGGCNRPTSIVHGGPFTVGESLPEGGDQYEILNGVANDEVARLVLYQANGEVMPVSLSDNMYAVRALRAAFPVRLVAYDSVGRVIGVKTLETDQVNR